MHRSALSKFVSINQFLPLHLPAHKNRESISISPQPHTPSQRRVASQPAHPSSPPHPTPLLFYFFPTNVRACRTYLVPLFDVQTGRVNGSSIRPMLHCGPASLD